MTNITARGMVNFAEYIGDENMKIKMEKLAEKQEKEQAERLLLRSERSAKIKETHKKHEKLIKLGAAWLFKNPPTKGNMYCTKCSIVATELSTFALENPDVIGFANDTNSVLLEAKISRADFKRDFKKKFRINPELGLGNFRLYITPKGLIKTEELPEGWGLLEVDEKDKIRLVKPAERQTANKEDEIYILTSLLRRIGQDPPEGVSIRCYTYETKNNSMLIVKKEEEWK